MRKNFFGETYLQPGDDIFEAWFEVHGDSVEDLTAHFIEQDEDDGTWGCELSDVTYEMYVEGFATCQDLEAWLNQQQVRIDPDS